MAIDEETFYTITGEEVNRSKLVQEMINYYGLKLEVGETRITDFNEGSEIRNLLEAIAVDMYDLKEDQNELAKIAFIETAEGEWLDKHGALPWINIARSQGTSAQGVVTFSLVEAQADEFVIPDGTIVASTENDLQYVTNGDCIISVGDTSADVTVSCVTVGSDGNCSKDTITVIDDDYLDVSGLSVNNSSACVDGTDYEEDWDYRERLLAYVRQDDFGSIGYYKSLCCSVDGVHDVILKDKTNYTKEVIVNGYSKPISDATKAEVIAVLSDLNNIVLGHHFYVSKASSTTFNVTLALNVTAEYETDTIKEVLNKFVDGGTCSFDTRLEFTGANLNETVEADKLLSILQVLDNIVDGTITVTNSGGTSVDTLTPSTNTAVKLGTISITQTVVS